jgi:hypothetical protein
LNLDLQKLKRIQVLNICAFPLLDVNDHVLTHFQKGVALVLVGCEIIIFFGAVFVKSVEAFVR